MNKSELKNYIQSFADLREDWDTYGAEVISIESINAACKLIDIIYDDVLDIYIYIYPVCRGCVQIEFLKDNFEYEVEIYSIYQLCLLLIDLSNNKTYENSYRMDEFVEKLKVNPLWKGLVE